MFVLELNSHAGNAEHAARRFWLAALRLPPDPEFPKTFVSPKGPATARTTSNMVLLRSAFVGALISFIARWDGSTACHHVSESAARLTANLPDGSLAQFGRAGAS